MNYLHLPTWWARPDKRAGGTDLDSAFAFMASSWKEMKFSDRRGRCAGGICSRRVSSASALPEMQLPALSAAKWSQLWHRSLSTCSSHLTVLFCMAVFYRHLIYTRLKFVIFQVKDEMHCDLYCPHKCK